ncbi:hypothetical protein NDU88_000773 [Pleurodeles waltl]|uniref:Uncharacterized protein n=1 Tax=Pleurodeles waltl TaxID=8319 RepID=A0AAV7TGU5_PLEWA|nr:hypothetical protein NDU88_000773 [Pleurodeles waltl]
MQYTSPLQPWPAQRISYQAASGTRPLVLSSDASLSDVGTARASTGAGRHLSSPDQMTPSRGSTSQVEVPTGRSPPSQETTRFRSRWLVLSLVPQSRPIPGPVGSDARLNAGRHAQVHPHGCLVLRRGPTPHQLQHGTI